MGTMARSLPERPAVGSESMKKRCGRHSKSHACLYQPHPYHGRLARARSIGGYRNRDCRTRGAATGKQPIGVSHGSTTITIHQPQRGDRIPRKPETPHLPKPAPQVACVAAEQLNPSSPPSKNPAIFLAFSPPFPIQSHRQKGERNHGGLQLNSQHHNQSMHHPVLRHTAPQPRARRRKTKPLRSANLTSPWLFGYVAIWRSFPCAGAPHNRNPANARQTLPKRPKPRHISISAKRSHLPKQQSPPPHSLALKQPRAGAK
jgi:hypothetical protein